MGSRGPAPKPTNLRVLHGDRKDRTNTAEPVPAKVEIKMPTWLSAAARGVWRQYAPDLERKGVLTAWDVEAFAIVCDAVVRRRTAVKKLREEGEVLKVPMFDPEGAYLRMPGTAEDGPGEIVYRRVKNPWTIVLTEADGQILRWGGRFGMTPSDRAQLSLEGGGRRGPAEDLLT